VVECFMRKATRLALVSLICLLAAANYLTDVFLQTGPRLPIFVDTIFTVGVAFALGIVPGIAVAILSHLLGVIILGNVHVFFLVAIAEATMVGLLRPARYDKWNAARPSQKSVYHAYVFTTLMKIYIVCVIAVSVLGGVIEFLQHVFGNMERAYFIGIDAFRLSFLGMGIHELGASILSRILVNLISRIVIIFGGYLVAWGINTVADKILQPWPLPQRHQ